MQNECGCTSILEIFVEINLSKDESFRRIRRGEKRPGDGVCLSFKFVNTENGLFNCRRFSGIMRLRNGAGEPGECNMPRFNFSFTGKWLALKRGSRFSFVDKFLSASDIILVLHYTALCNIISLRFVVLYNVLWYC